MIHFSGIKNSVSSAVGCIAHKDLIVPAVATVALFSEANKDEFRSEKAHNLCENIAGAFISTAMGINNALMLGTAAVIITIRSLGKKEKREKVSGIVKDALWFGSGIAAKKFFSMNFWYKNSVKPKNILGFVANMSSFMVGSLIVAPVLNKFAQKYLVNRFFPKEEESGSKDKKLNALKVE